MVQKIHSNTLLDIMIMIMMLLDCYASSFHKWLAMVENLKVMQQCPLRIAINNFLKKYNQIWKRVEKLLKIEFDSEPVYGDNDKYIKTKIKIYAGSMITNFQSKKMPK